MARQLLNVQEMAVYVGSSVQTIGSWYKWKAMNPTHPLAKLLPDYKRVGNRNTRYWERDDIEKLIQFKVSLPQGRNGIMGSVTQQYVKKNKEAK